MTWTIFVVCLGFVACSSPISCFYVFMLLGDYSAVYQVKLYYLCNSLCHLQNCADFFIYALMSKQYRAAYMLLARDICTLVKEIVLGQRTTTVHSTTVFIHKEVLRVNFSIKNTTPKSFQAQQGSARNFQSISVLVNEKRKTGIKYQDEVTGSCQHIANNTRVVVVTKFQNDNKKISRESVRRSSESEVGSFVQVDQTEVVAAFWAENKREFLSVSVQTNHGGSSLKLSVAGISDSLMHMRKMSL